MPVIFRQSEQWHIRISRSGPAARKRTSPQWHPPSKSFPAVAAIGLSIFISPSTVMSCRHLSGRARCRKSSSEITASHTGATLVASRLLVKIAQIAIQVEQRLGDEMQHRLFTLDTADDTQNLRAQHRVAIGLGQFRPDDHIQRIEPVLKRQEHRALGGAWALAHRHQPGKPQAPAVGRLMRHRAGLPAIGGEVRLQKPHRMRLQRQPEAAIIGRHLLASLRAWQRHLRLGAGNIVMPPRRMRE